MEGHLNALLNMRSMISMRLPKTKSSRMFVGWCWYLVGSGGSREAMWQSPYSRIPYKLQHMSTRGLKCAQGMGIVVQSSSKVRHVPHH